MYYLHVLLEMQLSYRQITWLREETTHKGISLDVLGLLKARCVDAKWNE